MANHGELAILRQNCGKLGSDVTAELALISEQQLHNP